MIISIVQKAMAGERYRLATNMVSSMATEKRSSRLNMTIFIVLKITDGEK